MEPTILLTGFEPFGGDQRNPSLDAVRLVENKFDSPDANLIVSPLAVEFEGARKQLNQLLNEHNPDIVVCVGLAAGRTTISFERVAINLADARIADNAGFQPVDQPLVQSEQNAFFTTLPIKRAVSALNNEGIPASVSYSAGTYVCNAAMYYVLHQLHEQFGKSSSAQGGFIHVPDAYAENPPMTITQIADGIELALKTFIEALRDNQSDLEITMGTEY